MSLINDALKRAKQAHTENPTPTPDLPFRPAEPAPNRNSAIPVLPLAVLLIAIVLGGGLILMALKRTSAGPQVVHAAQPEVDSPATPAPVEATPQAATPAVATTGHDSIPTVTAPQVQLVRSPVPDSPPASTPENPIPPSSPEPSKPAVPKLQGIFYNPSRPSAVVNGRTVYVGSRAGENRDFLVLEITRESVKVACGNQTNLLVLEE